MILLINLMPFLFLAQETSENVPPQVSAAASLPGIIVGALVCAFMWWKVFTKAGQPGWASIIPIVNIYFLCKVAGRPGWWLILFLIPCVNFVMFIVIALDVAKRFGKSGGFAVGLIFLPFIFYPILGFGSAQYQGAPAAA
jgi:Family of unknown function (DUF5684)